MSPTLFIAVETHVTSDINDGELSIFNYKIIRSNSTSRHSAGIAMYVDQSIKFEIINDVCYNLNNIIIVDILNGPFRGRWLIVYHSPNTAHNVFLDELIKVCEMYLSNGGTIYVVGDFNINCHQNNRVDTYKSRLIRIMSFYGLKLTVNKFTRVTENSKTLIDLVFTNNTTVTTSVSASNLIADHKSIILTKQTSSKKKIVKKIVTDRSSYSKVALNQRIVEKLNCQNGQVMSSQVMSSQFMSSQVTSGQVVPGQSMLQVSSLESKVKLVESVIKESVNEICFKKEIIVNYSNKWFDNSLKELRNQKNSLCLRAQILNTAEDWSEYRRVRNLFTQKSKVARNKMNRKIVSDLKHDPKQLWKALKKSYSDAPSHVIDKIEINDVTFNDPKTLANELNQFFVNSITELNSSIPTRPFTDRICNFNEWHSFELINMGQLMSILSRIKKKSGMDNVNIDVLRDSIESLGEDFLSIVNESLASGYCPVEWRKTTVVPIPKVQKPKVAEDLRPVNTIPIIDKVMQCIVREQLQTHIDDNNILTDFQSAFRSNHSCQTVINLILSEWKREVGDGKVIIAVFLDLKRAFETIDRNTMVKVLENYGVKGNVLNWFKSWLSNRTQQTKLNDEMSSSCSIDVGLPQGTPLSCVLFILYINAIFQIVRRSKIKLFADDTLCWVVADSSEVAQKVIELNQDLHQLSLFFESRKMKLNVTKTKYMVISQRNVNTLNVTPIVGGQLVERVYEMKYLGVIIDHKLKFDAHVQYVKKKLVKKINYLQRNKYMYDRNTKLMLYKSLVSPHIDYCSSVLFLINESQMRELQILQNRALRAILKCDFQTNIESMLRKLKLLDVKQRVYFNVLIIIHKLKLGILPTYLCQNLQYVRDSQPYSLRSNDRFRLPAVLSGQAQNSLMYKGVALYNNMMDTAETETFSSFKKNLIDYVKDNFRSH